MPIKVTFGTFNENNFGTFAETVTKSTKHYTRQIVGENNHVSPSHRL